MIEIQNGEVNMANGYCYLLTNSRQSRETDIVEVADYEIILTLKNLYGERNVAEVYCYLRSILLFTRESGIFEFTDSS